MSKRQDEDLISDIKEAAKRVKSYVALMSYEKFMCDSKTQDAVVRNLEIIGEAAKNLSEATKKKYSHIPWKNLAGVRDRLIHQYFGVNYEIVWTIVKDELPSIIMHL